MSKKLKVLVGGGTGFIGEQLCSQLTRHGHEVSLISRKIGPGRITWRQVEDASVELPQCDAVVNISGANLMGKKLWTSSYRQEVIDSRVNTTRALAKAIKGNRFKGGRPSVFVVGTAEGIYPRGIPGPTVDESTTDVAATFSGQLVQQWEGAATLDDNARGADRSVNQRQTEPEGKEGVVHTRLVKVRTGVVLGPGGGALGAMLPPFRFGIAHIPGTGKQWFPWIHIRDIVGIFEHAVTNDSVSGVLNGVAPNYVTTEELTKEISKVLGGRKLTVHIPSFLMKLMFGKDRQDLLLEGHKVIPKYTLESGYRFQFPHLHEALQDILK